MERKVKQVSNVNNRARGSTRRENKLHGSSSMNEAIFISKVLSLVGYNNYFFSSHAVPIIFKILLGISFKILYS